MTTATIDHEVTLKYIPLAKTEAKKYRTLDPNDALGTALEALVIASQNYKREKGDYFGPYARKIISHELWKQLQVEIREAPSVDFQVIEHETGEEHVTGFTNDGVHGPPVYIEVKDIAIKDQFAWFECVQTFRSWLTTLSEDQKAVLFLRMKGLRQNEIVKQFKLLWKQDISQSTVSRLLKEMQQSLRKALYDA